LPDILLFENFSPRNINNMPAGKIFESLDLDQICLFLDEHALYRLLLASEGV